MKTIKNNFTGKGKYKMEFIIQVAIKLTIGFTALLIYMNINGKGQLAPVTATDQIGNYVLGGIVGGVIYNPGITVVQFLIVLLIWISLMTAINFLKNSSEGVKKVFDGEMVFLVKDGEIIKENFAKVNLSLVDFYTKMRMKGVVRVKDIDKAFVESNGQITILQKHDKNLAIPLVAEGKILETGLEHIEKNSEWLMAQLKEKGVDNLTDVFLAEWSEDKLFVVTK